MQILPRSLVAAAVLLPLWHPAPAATERLAPERLTYAPAPGLPVRYEHEVDHLLTTRAMRTREEGGEAVTGQGMDTATRLRLSVTEVVLEPGPERPARFRRLYDRAHLGAEVRLVHQESLPPMKLDTGGAVEGKSVVFTWVEEEGEYGRHYDAEEWVEEELPRLAHEQGFRAFLPPGEVEPGASWRVDPLELRHAVGPGGALGFDMARIGDPALGRTLRAGLGTHMYEAFGEVLEGELVCTYRGRREVEGRDLAVIELRFQVTARGDLTRLMNRSRSPVELDAGFRIELYHLDLTLDGQGEILWDPRGGHLASATFSGQETVVARMRAVSATRVDQDIELEGSFSSRVRAQADPEHVPAKDWRSKGRG